MTKAITMYYASNSVAGYSGWVMYGYEGQLSHCYWMVPGTFFDDWDNR